MNDHQAHATRHQHGHGGGDTTDRHGMLLFGREVLYLSHLPMFQHPHNFQVILEVGLDAVVLKTLLTDRALSGDGMYTFDPVLFPIAELDPRGNGPIRESVKGTIVRGHFERGGTPIANGVTVDVHRVVHFRELDINEKPAENQDLNYLCFGRAGLLHLAHEITARPSFDHVLTVRLVPNTVTTQVGSPLPDVTAFGFDLAQRVRFSRSDLAENRLAPSEIVTGLFGETSSLSGTHGFTVQVEVERELYIEIRELA